MSKYTPNAQLRFQSKILDSIDLDKDIIKQVKNALSSKREWWYNTTNPESLRLTATGFVWLTRVANIEFYTVALSQPLVSKHYVLLERLFKSPYFIRADQKTINLFDQGDTVMLHLHNGNLTAYLNSLNSTNF